MAATPTVADLIDHFLKLRQRLVEAQAEGSELDPASIPSVDEITEAVPHLYTDQGGRLRPRGGRRGLYPSKGASSFAEAAAAWYRSHTTASVWTAMGAAHWYGADRAESDRAETLAQLMLLASGRRSLLVDQWRRIFPTTTSS